MAHVVPIAVESVIPAPESVWRALSVPESAADHQRLQDLGRQATDRYQRLASPIGILQEISTDEFEGIFAGEGRNDPDSPLGLVYPLMRHLALFAVTIGQIITDEVSTLFDKRDFALATALDAVASEGCELASSKMEREFIHSLLAAVPSFPAAAVVRFSPGYCGWHLTAQHLLFQFLQPQCIGIELLNSCLMKPLKSISGVIAVGSKDILENAMTQPACLMCKTKSCLDRISLITERQEQRV